MKKLFLFLLILILTTAAVSADDCELVFSSFDNGGPEYRITVDDPSIISVISIREDEEPGDDDLFGPPYRMIFRFTGLKPGETTITISAHSLIAEYYDAEYQVMVDEDLYVRLSHDRHLAQMRLYRAGEMMPSKYEILLLNGEYMLYKGQGGPAVISHEVIEKLIGILDTYNVYAWDGFSESNPDVLDGEFFSFRVIFSDGEVISAQGDNAFPPDYFRAAGEIEQLLNTTEEEPDNLCGTFVYEKEGFGGSFTISLHEDGSFNFYEGPLSSYIGTGDWYQEGPLLTLYEDNEDYSVNHFLVGNGILVFAETDSDNFPYIALQDGDKFILLDE